MAKSRAGWIAAPLPKIVRVGVEADAGAAPVMDLAEVLELLDRLAAGEALAIEPPAARDLDLERNPTAR